MIDISVIVPFYNSEAYIERCVVALLKQDYPSGCYEIIMVNNNSTDRSAELVGKYPEVRLLSECKQGSYAARNRGVAESRGGILTFTDADCVASPRWLKELVEPLSSPEIELVLGARELGRDSPSLLIVKAFMAELAAFMCSREATGTPPGYTNNMAMRRETFDRFGPFMEVGRGADVIFAERVAARYSREVVRYAAEAWIRHLEITSVRQWIQRKAAYGKSFQQNLKMRDLHKGIGLGEIVMILRRTARKGSYSAARSAWLCFIVAMAKMSFLMGRLGGLLVIAAGEPERARQAEERERRPA